MAKPGSNANGLKPQYTFEDLVIGSNNHIPAKACLEVVKLPGEAYNPLFLYGQAGGGKTHLMHAVANAMLKDNPDLNVKYISAERFMHEVIAAISEDRVMQVRDFYSGLDLWLIDDIQFLMESKTAQSEFFHILNNLTQDNRQIIIGSDISPNKLTKLDKNILSRLSSGLSAELKVPDVKARMEILQMKEKKYQLSMSKEMLQYAAGMIRANVRELEGFLKKVNAYVTLSHQELNMDLVTHVVQEMLPDGATEMKPEPIPDEPPKKEPPQKAKESKQEAVMTEQEQQEIKELNQTLQKAQGQDEPVPPMKTASTAPPAMPTDSPKKKSKPLEVVMPSQPKEIKPPEPPPAPPIEDPPPAPEEPPKEEPSAQKTVSQPVEPPPVEEKEKPEEEKPAEPAEAQNDLSDLEEEEEQAVPAGHKKIGAVFFYPSSCEDALRTVHQKFQDVIKKHKLKFVLKKMHSEPFDCSGKVDYASFVDVCKKNKVPVAIVIGPPPTAFIPEQDFYDLLSVTLDVQGISLQLVNWSEINKDYRYLNLALDIALVRSR